MPPARYPPTEQSYSYRVRDETMDVPYRHYSELPAQEELNGLSESMAAVLAAMYTRSTDGRVRENALDSLLSWPSAWSPGFVLPLLGEYVVEINRDIRDAVEAGRIPREEWKSFVIENPELIELTRARAISYLDAYGASWLQGVGEDSALSAFVALDGLGCVNVAEAVSLLARWRERVHSA